jgi:hypothetical protein
MPATTLAGTIRYLPPGIRQIYWVPTIADIQHPTLVELNGGTDITGEIVDGSVSGFKTTPSTVDAPDLGSKITRKAQGRTTLDESILALYLSEDGQDARSLFTDGEVGNIVIFPEGNHVKTPALSCDVWPVTVLTTTIDPDTTKLAQVMVDFAVTDLPAKNVPIPAT